MTKDQETAIENFFVSVSQLKELGIIRSDKYLGDIAEFLGQCWFGLELAESGRQVGYDGKIGKAKIQVKFNGGGSTTVNCGDPNEYDELMIVLGPDSALRTADGENSFQIYRIPSDAVLRREPHSDGKRRYSKNQLPTEYMLRLLNDA